MSIIKMQIINKICKKSEIKLIRDRLKEEGNVLKRNLLVGCDNQFSISCSDKWPSLATVFNYRLISLPVLPKNLKGHFF